MQKPTVPLPQFAEVVKCRSIGTCGVPVAEKTYLFRAPYYDFYIQLLRKVGLFGYR